MTPSRLIQLESLLEEAAALPPEEQPAFITAACGGDAELRRELVGLLRADAVAAAPLDQPVLGAALPKAALEAGGPLPTRIGMYRVLRLLGEGGMGLVYAAEQDNPRRRVALKLLRPGLASPQALKRFELEAQLLGRLQHPGIAQIYEAGTAEVDFAGVRVRQPFLAMEFVDGQPLTTFAERAGLSQRQRIALVAEICEAVHHAHQRGVIHRDLKPGNILVDERGRPKVLDFGVARVIDADFTSRSVQTLAGQIIGTLPYMSPEQVSGAAADVDVRSDVYSLGVVLYELLCRRLPHDAPSSADLIDRIVRSDPPRPSTLQRELRGDIETVLLKALDRDRDRRYQSLAQLAQDLRRLLANEPIEARRNSALYVLRKTVARHRVVTGLALLFVLTATVSAVALAILYGRSQQERAVALARAEELRRSAYFNMIALADAAVLSGNSVALPHLLEECPADLRRWEWSYLRRISATARRTIRGPRTIAGAIFTPAGDRFATWGVDRQLRLWDTAAGLPIAEMSSPTMLDCGAFLDDGAHIAVGGRDGVVQIWNVDTCDRVRGLPTSVRNWIAAVAVSPDRKLLAAGGNDGHVRVWELPGFTALWEAQAGAAVGDVAFSPDSERIVAGASNGTLRLWDAWCGAALAADRSHHDQIRAVAFSLDGRHLLSCDNSGDVHVSSAADARQIRNYTCGSDGAQILAVSPNGRSVAVGAYSAIRTWDFLTGRELPARLGHRAQVAALAFDSSGERLISGDAEGELMLWDGEPPAEPATLVGHTDFVRGIAISPDGRRIASCGRDRTVRLWDTATAAPLAVLTGHKNWVKSVAFSPDGNTLASGGYDGSVRVWDLRTVAARGKRADSRVIETRESRVRSLAISADGRTLAVGQARGVVQLFDLATRAERGVLDAGKDMVFRLCFSRDGRRLATATEGHGDLRLWDVETGRLERNFDQPHGALRALALSGDDQLLAAGGDDGAVRIWAAASGALLHEMQGHRQSVQSLAFSPDSARLASGHFGRLIHIWDPREGRLALTLRAHEGSVTGVAFSADGRFLVSGSNDKTVCIWHTDPAFRPALPRPVTAPATDIADDPQE